MRAKRLASWFPTCWCARCAADEDDVRRFRLLPRGADAKVLHGAHEPTGGAVEDVRGEDLAAAQRALFAFLDGLRQCLKKCF